MIITSLNAPLIYNSSPSQFSSPILTIEETVEVSTFWPWLIMHCLTCTSVPLFPVKWYLGPEAGLIQIFLLVVVASILLLDWSCMFPILVLQRELSGCSSFSDLRLISKLGDVSLLVPH